MRTREKGLSSAALKGIAAVFMFLDHLALLIVYPLYQSACMVNGVDRLGAAMPAEAHRWYLLYWILRSVGRMAFPLFAYLLVEGFLHTRNRVRYAGRLLLFALISEAVFDYPWTKEAMLRQNVLWTLLIGLILLSCLEAEERRGGGEKRLRILRDILAGMLAAYLMGTDYGFCGVLLIAVFYLFRDDFRKQVLYGGLVLLFYTAMLTTTDRILWVQIWSVGAFLPLYFYDGRKGGGPRYFFYVFYPAHLLLLEIAGQLL